MTTTRLSTPRPRTTLVPRPSVIEPIGSILPLAYETTPAAYLVCNGAAISRTVYSDLFSAIGTTWGAGDGSTTFALPDLRGLFLRGLDDGRGYDTSRSLGTYQDQDVAAHIHTGLVESRISSSSNAGRMYPNGPTGSNSGVETRPKNYPVVYIIRFM